MMMLETDSPETLNEMLVSVRKMGRAGIIAVYTGFANGINVGALMEKGIRYAIVPQTLNSRLTLSSFRLIGNGQAPVHLYWNEILNDYIMTGKFDPTLYVKNQICT
jgi:threonine dehydrogenase-like Zn-dependent dehydrogenase